ncbi:MAG: hypothetical protein EOQ52_02040 [Mesorhizobium sp.]|uniref:hypothetical protein n=1 Tax=Mesorhizobium sp. TaxID=1871066 RepID=UPI000FE7D2F9|nr:hypothetical protein [Mesorhizobium sp.]RWB92308.1 MAG: hypothetical protein EOQ52_02040 [Mesorhizobium sp.]TGS70480.1 hypothetical protein EN844_07000 [Mesorhizobium sp. M3A.F.Ca.ET.201.01.1.1]TGT63755.1 hypothetical protein EN813_010320 [Mesorhizobium sp. M00.F.Ca.ET.170.01.1.1]
MKRFSVSNCVKQRDRAVRRLRETVNRSKTRMKQECQPVAGLSPVCEARPEGSDPAQTASPKRKKTGQWPVF